MIRSLIAALAVLTPAAAQADWHEAASKHFVVYADQDPEKLKQYTAELERFDQSLRFLTGTPDKPLSPMMRVQVYVASSVDEIQQMARSSGVAGFYSPRSSGPRAFVPAGDGGGALDARTILQHEYCHAFMFSTWPSVVFPKWFVEGFAEFFGTAFYRQGELIIGKSPDYRTYGIDRTANVPAKRLLSLDPRDKDLDTQTLYGRGWLLTHYSFLGGHAKELGAYIAAINAGKPIDEANKAFGPINELDGKLNGWAKRGALPTIRLDKDKVPVGEVTVRRLSPGEAATIKAQMYSQAGVDAKRAVKVLAMARAAAAAYPNDAAAQNELAEAEFDARNYAESEAAADRALDADPASIHAMLYKGMAQMAQAKADKVTDPARWNQIRSWFIKANRADTEYPEPLVLYYESYGAAGQKPSEAAENGLLKAYLLAPFDNDLRFRAGMVLLRRNMVDPAKIAFEKIAYGPHVGSDNPARAILEALNTGGAQAALKVYEDIEAKAKQREADDDRKRG
jgi:tetratricopeptide (TPR) repeat protein